MIKDFEDTDVHMSLSIRRVSENSMHYRESGEDSDVQLVFLSGGLSPAVWKHQERYFSKKYLTVRYRPTVSFRDYRGEESALNAVLDQKHIDNAVLVSHFMGNSLAQSMEKRDDVKATVLTSPAQELSAVSSSKMIGLAKSLTYRWPKLFRKLLMADETGYDTARTLWKDIDSPETEDIRSFLRNHSLREPRKKSLVIHPCEGRFSSLDLARDMSSGCGPSCLRETGSLAFYEKPGEYNKALHDFMGSLKTRETGNRSLTEFEERLEKVRKKVKV